MPNTMEQRNVLLGVTGSIAAYKSAELARILVSRGYQVRVVMSNSAKEFISPLTMQSLTGNPVVTSFWDNPGDDTFGHIELADWADGIVIAPATADVIAKIAMGFAEDPMLASILVSRAPLLVAPAMNVNMYEHPKTQENLSLLKERGITVIEPEEGALACGWNGAGRLADVWDIFYHIGRILSPMDYRAKRVLVTTGPTREPIDPVRFISNRSSGKMGMAIAGEAFRRGADVRLIHGPISSKVPSGITSEAVLTAQQMNDAVMSHFQSEETAPDIIIMAAAVADYRISEPSDTKIKRNDSDLSINLVQNPDILKELGEKRADAKKPILVGFAVETGEIEDLLNEARRKLEHKDADMIVGNFAVDAFDLDTNHVWLIDRYGRQEEVQTTFKSRVANKILDVVLKL